MAQPTEPLFQLNGSTLAGIGAVLGALAGGISFLFKALITAKDEALIAKDVQIDNLTRDRDYWRDMAVRLMEPAERAIGIADDAVRRARSR